MERTDVVKTIKKLMALADRATNEHEAALAAERMQAFLQDHNLTRAEVEGQSEEEADNPLKAQREKTEHTGSAMYTYQRNLMETIAENNFCLHFIRSRYKDFSFRKRTLYIGEYETVTERRYVRLHEIIGRVENVQATTLMYDYLLGVMRNLNPYKGEDRGNAQLWLQGCTETLCLRLTEQRTGRQAKDDDKAQAPGLVRLADLYGNEEDLNNDFRMGHEPGTTAKKRLEREAKERAIEAKEQDLINKGTDSDDAWYLARGRLVPPPEPAQVQRRSRSSYSWGGNRGWSKEYREQTRRESTAFRAGKAKGRDIGLGGSIGAGKAIDA